MLLRICILFLGTKEFVALGISADKLVSGLPWYGYNYPCYNYTKVSHLCQPTLNTLTRTAGLQYFYEIDEIVCGRCSVNEMIQYMSLCRIMCVTRTQELSLALLTL